MRLKSLTAVGRDVGRLARDISDQVRALGRPNALMWLTDASRPEEVAAALSDACEASVGGVSTQGLVGGGGEHASSREPSRVVVLALSALGDGAEALPWHSPPDGLPELPADTWASWAALPPAASPHLLLLASPSAGRSFAVERWLHRLDTSLPWARKVGGLTVGDGRLFVGSEAKDGGAVGLALSGVEMDALVCQGALPVGPSFEISDSEANIIKELNGRPVGEALDSVLKQFEERPTGNLMAGVSVPMRPAAAVPAHAPVAPALSTSPYVVRAILGYSSAHSALIVGASPELLQAPNARLQLHAFSADNARQELRANAAAWLEQTSTGSSAPQPAGACGGGLMVSCLGRGTGLYGEAGVESAELEHALGAPLELTGFFAGGEIGPVGSRTFVHTYTTCLGLLRSRR